MLLIIDNYDSFTYNLVHYLGELGEETIVKRNDAIGVEDALAMGANGIVLSPGPCTPDKAGICLELVKRASGQTPILGVCLGHQSIAQAFGAKIVRASTPKHGKPSFITHNNRGVFEGLPTSFKAIRYHSLVIDPTTVPKTLEVSAESEDTVIMGIAHTKYPIFGVQFHPESIDTESGHLLLSNFIIRARDWSGSR
ncbi:MAG: aminodeoxychorismate/anthranilate synthase component II [Pseudomonadota bacterium]|nr:aminodeoxychorismate/anthranilate synthase component II [Pseudomonadota bacterium]